MPWCLYPWRGTGVLYFRCWDFVFRDDCRDTRYKDEEETEEEDVRGKYCNLCYSIQDQMDEIRSWYPQTKQVNTQTYIMYHTLHQSENPGNHIFRPKFLSWKYYFLASNLVISKKCGRLCLQGSKISKVVYMTL